MGKKVYLDKIKAKTGIPKVECEQVLKEFFFILKEELAAKGRVNIHRFGTFTVKKTKPHAFFSPVDGKTIKTKGITKVYFSSSKELLKQLSGADYGNSQTTLLRNRKQ
ncbi:MAG TPA: HU family DNA-binding protein [Bacilli bacterium]